MILSIYLITAGLGWAIAQITKYVLGILSGGQWYDTKAILNSGNMPSVHTATTVALTMAIGLHDGVSSPVFAVSFLLMAIVAYDAMGVRRSSGEQGLALRSLLTHSKDAKIKSPYLALGHKPLEVAVGAIIGVAVSMFVAFFTPFF